MGDWRLLAEDHEVAHGVMDSVDELVEIVQLANIRHALVAEFNDLV